MRAERLSLTQPGTEVRKKEIQEERKERRKKER